MPQESTKDAAEKEKVMRSRRGTVDTELSALTAFQSSLDVDDAPYRARLYQLFGHIEKEFDTLYAENCALRARIVQLTQTEGEAANVVAQEVFGVQEPGKSSRKAIQMGQKLRTALRGPPVFRDGSKFRLSRLLEGHKDGVWHVAADSTRNVCASASADQTARIWSLESGACLATYLGHTGSVNCVAISSNCPIDTSEGSGTAAGLLLATASGDESTHIWRVPSNNAPLEHSSEEEEENHGGVSGGGNRDPNNLLGVQEHNKFQSSNEKSDGHRIRSPVMKLTGHRAPVSCCEWLAGGQQMVTASWDRTANVWDVEKGEVVNILSGHESELNHCSTHSTHKLVLTSSKDSTFRLWDFRESIQSVAVFQGHQDSVTSVSFNTDYRIVSSSDDATVKIWDLRNMRTPLATIRLSSPANRVSISKSSHAVIAVPMDNRHVRIYDLNGNRLPRMPNRRCHERMVTCCAWLDDHPTNNLLTSGFDRMVAAWKVNTTTSS